MRFYGDVSFMNVKTLKFNIVCGKTLFVSSFSAQFGSLETSLPTDQELSGSISSSAMRFYLVDDYSMVCK